MAVEKLTEEIVNADMVDYLKGVPQADLWKIGMDASEIKTFKTRLSTIRKDGRILVSYKKGRCGRYTTTKGLQMVRGKLRRLMTPAGWGEIDLINAHYHFIQDEATQAGLDLKALKDYNANREEYLKKVGGSRGEAKVCFLRVLYGGEPAENDHQIIHDIHKDINAFKEVKMEELVGYVALAKQFSKKAGRRDLNTGLAYYCFERESKVMEILMANLRTGGYDRKIHIHDGICIDNINSVTDALYNQTKLQVKQKYGWSVEFATKSFDATEQDEIWFSKVKALSKYNPSDTIELGDFTDVDICDIVFQALKDEGSRVVKCNGDLYYYTQERGYYKKMDKTHNELYDVFCKDKVSKMYVARISRFTGLKKMFFALVKEDPELTMKASNVTGLLCLGDGTMWDMKNHERIESSQDVVFTKCLSYVPKDRNDALVDIVKNQLFYNPLGKLQGDFLLNCFARGFAKHYEDKRLYLLIGMSNAGKGVIMNSIESAFAGLVGHFNTEDLMYKKGGADTAKSLSWALGVSRYSVGFSNEVEMGEGCSLSGNLIKKGASGGDVLSGRYNHQDEVEFVLSTALFCAMNDLPQIKPLDEGVRNRLFTFKFDKAFVDKVTQPEYELQGDKTIKAKIKTMDWKSALFWAILDAYTPEMCDAPKECKDFKQEMVEEESDESKIKKLFVPSKNGEYTKTSSFHKRVLGTGMVMTLTKLSTTMKRLGFPVMKKEKDGEKFKAYQIVMINDNEGECDI